MEWRKYFQEATVALEVPDPDGSTAYGTGFLLTPTLVATSAHVVAEDPSRLPESATGRIVALGRQLSLKPDPSLYFRDPDLALLRVLPTAATAFARLKPILVGSDPRPGDALWSFGHPHGRFREGEPARLTLEGTARSLHGEPLLRVRGTALRQGCSGSAVACEETGGVVGMVTTSDRVSSAHLLPVSAILERCPEAEGVRRSPPQQWLRALSDEQIRRGGWRFPGPTLCRYWQFVQQTVTMPPWSEEGQSQHPPPSQFYIQRSVRSTGDTERVPRSADKVFVGAQDTVLTGGPGIGKSSLLRMGALDLALRFRQGEAGSAVPVLLHARDLVRVGPDLPRVMAESVSADRWSRCGFSADFFRYAPMAGAHWLVLVDGLDEIVDARRRNGVVALIERWRAHEDLDGTHYFLIATRSWDPGPATRPSGSWPRWEMDPLSWADLKALVERWFRAWGHPRAVSAERLVLQLLAGYPTEELLNSPLLVTLLCELFAANGEEVRLPTCLIPLYEQYEEFARRSWAGEGEGLPLTQLQAQITEVSGSEAAQAAVELYGLLPDLFPLAASARMSGDETGMMAILDRMTPAGLSCLSGDDRAKVLRAGLRRSGLFVERDGDFEFVHRTFAEFLAARVMAETWPRGLLAVRTAWRQSLELDRRVKEDPEDQSALFLAHALVAQRLPGVRQLLRRWAADSDQALMVAVLAANGVDLSEAVVERACTTLRDRLAGFDLQAAEALRQLGDPSGVDVAVKRAMDTRFLGVERWPAVRWLVAIEHPKACDALIGIALARDARDWLKLEAAGLLARMGDPNAEEALEALARRPRGDKRVEAVETLAEYRPDRVPDLMVAIAVGCYDSADRDRDTGERLWQSTVWRRLAAPVAVSVLKGLALDPHFGYFETRPRERAVKTLSCLPGSESTAALAELASAAAWEQVGTNVRETLWSGVTGSAAMDADHRARDTTFWLPVRLLAAQSLHERGAVEAADALAGVALNEREDGHSSRYHAALALVELGDPRAAGALESASPPPVFGRSPHLPPLGRRRRRRRG